MDRFCLRLRCRQRGTNASLWNGFSPDPEGLTEASGWHWDVVFSDTHEGKKKEMSAPQILLVDDEAAVCFVLERTLQREGYTIDVAVSGREALHKLATNTYDLILLDLHMEPIHGLTVFQAVREKDPDMVVLILTANGSLETAIQALRLGAFDYLFKPTEPNTIRQRVEAGLAHRRQLLQQRQIVSQIDQLRLILNQLETKPTPPPAKTNSCLADKAPLVIDTYHHTVTRDDQLLELTTAEFDLLLCLIKNAAQVMTPQQLVRCALNYNSEHEAAREIIKYHIHNLRRKLEPDPAQSHYIKTVRYKGYMWIGEAKLPAKGNN